MSDRDSPPESVTSGDGPPIAGAAVAGAAGPLDAMRRVLTLHGPLLPGALDVLLTGIEGALAKAGASRMTAFDEGRDIVVVATMPSED